MGQHPQQQGIDVSGLLEMAHTTRPKTRRAPDPAHLKGLRFRKRKQKTSVKREQLWTPEEHKVFLDYCEDLRLACYHAMARECGGRPSELLDLKISDVEVKVSPSTGKRYAEFWIGRTGKMKKGRPASISGLIPYFNVWKSVHPLRDNPSGAYLFPSRENKARYRNVPLKPDSLRLAYVRTIRESFPKLLLRPDIPLEDKHALKTLIYDKPHYPCLLRHDFATEIAPKVPQFVFNQLMGHSRTSKMYDMYVQDLGDEGNRELLIARGIISRDETMSKAQQQMTQPVYCPVCREPNKQQADFCFKCNWVLTTKGMQEVRAADMQALEEAAKQKKQLQEMTDEFKKMKAEQDREAKLVVMLVDDFRKKRKEGRKALLDNVEDFYAKVDDPNYHVDTSVIYNEYFYNDLDGGNSSSSKKG